jgi:hypothetical protein
MSHDLFARPPWWRLAAVLLLAWALTISLFVVADYYRNPEVRAVTVCLPGGVGRAIIYPSRVSSRRELEEVRRHEAAHIEQCRRYGMIGMMWRYASRDGALVLEAEALCRQARLHAVPDAGLAIAARTLAEYPQARGLEQDSLQQIVAAACHPLETGGPSW